MNETTLIWEMVLHMLFGIARLKFSKYSCFENKTLKVVISDLGFCCHANYSPQSGNIYDIFEYLVPKICKALPSFSVKLFGEKELLNNTDPIHMQFDVINGKHPMIKKHTPACHDTVEESQQRVIATHDNCNLNRQALILEET
ncbi:hypothetical protein G9A89_003274 [Geosiphon pyriformis]|nr:hypothetical protein G9A89_003274 [Geosiphon pyriformis]